MFSKVLKRRSKTPTWWEALKACRGLGKERGFTSFDVADRLGYAPNVASAQLSKLVRFGLLVRAGSRKTDEMHGRARAWCRLYKLTEYGATRPTPRQAQCPGCGYKGSIREFFNA